MNSIARAVAGSAAWNQERERRQHGTPYPVPPAAYIEPADEHEHQVMLFDWRDRVVGQRPRLALVHAIPNGGARPKKVYQTKSGRWRSWSPGGARLKAEGVVAGVPDILVPFAAGGFIGCWLELKMPGKTAEPAQRRRLLMLRDAGHFCAVCWGWREGRQWLERYDDEAIDPAAYPDPVRVKRKPTERDLLGGWWHPNTGRAA